MCYQKKNITLYIISKKEKSGKIEKWISATLEKGICKMSWIIFRNTGFARTSLLLQWFDEALGPLNVIRSMTDTARTVEGTDVKVEIKT